jgi:hypothetical protein
MAQLRGDINQIDDAKLMGTINRLVLFLAFSCDGYP